MGNLLSVDIFENEDHYSEEDVILENSNSLIEQYAFQVLDFSSQYGYEILFFGSIDLKKTGFPRIFWLEKLFLEYL